MQLKAIAIELQYTNTQENQDKARSLFKRVSHKLRILSKRVDSEPLTSIQRDVKCLSRQIRQDLLPEGVLLDGKIYIISQELLEGDPEVFWQAITEINNPLMDCAPSPRIKIGSFIYKKSTLLKKYKTFPPYELATSISCVLKGGEGRDLSIGEVRLLMAYSPELKMPEELNLPNVDPVCWNVICQSVILGVKLNRLPIDQQNRLQVFLEQHRPDLLSAYPFKPQKSITISSDSLSLTKDQFRTEMKQLLGKCPEVESVTLELGYRNDKYLDNEIAYRLRAEDFRRLLDDLGLDPTFKMERQTSAICRFSNNQEGNISLLEMRILLRKNPWDPLPDTLDMCDINQAYLPYLLQTAWNPTWDQYPNPMSDDGECRFDQIYYLLRFFFKYHRYDYFKYMQKEYPKKGYSFLRGEIILNLSSSFFQLSSSDFKKFTEFLLGAFPNFDQLTNQPLRRLDSIFEVKTERLTFLLGDPQFSPADLLTFLLEDPQFSPADLLSKPTVLLNDGLLHQLPFQFYYKVLFLFRESQWLINSDGSRRPLNLSSVSPNALHDAIHWYNYQEMPSSSFERIEAATLFLQEWSPDSPCTTSAQTYLANNEIIPMANCSTWEEVEDWVAPYAEAAPEKLIQVGENGSLYSRLFIHQLAKEKKIPFAFLTKTFRFRLSDGSTDSTDIASIYPFWNGFKATFDPQNPDAFASIENPIVLELPPGLFQRLNGFIHDPERSDYSVANLLSMRRFFHTHAFADCCQIVEKHLSSTREAIIKADWTQKDVWNSIKEQLQEVPKAHLLKIEGVRDKFSREALEFCIRDGTITQLEMDTIVD